VFDFRYHVASLAAVFVALVIGILVGVGLSGRGFVDDAERRNLQQEIASLREGEHAARAEAAAAARDHDAFSDYAEQTYPALVAGRLDDRRVALLYVGSVDPTVDFAVTGAIDEAGGSVVRMRALSVPVDPQAVDDALARRPALRSFRGPDELDRLGRALADELVAGGRTPLWDALADVLVEERAGSSSQAVDGVVIARSAPPQQGPTQDLLTSLYRGLAASRAASVGVEATGARRSAVPAFVRARLSTVDGVETPAGKLALVLVLGGAQPGSYGQRPAATNGVLPPVPPAPAEG
jgi:copper transport outer membrane protein MctB